MHTAADLPSNATQGSPPAENLSLHGWLGEILADTPGLADLLAMPADWPAERARASGGPVPLNHGSYGCVPRAVCEFRRAVLARVERDPVRFFKVDLERACDAVRTALSSFLRADAAGIALVPNATTAVATALHTIAANGGLGAGDEVLVTNHEYQATLNELDRICRRTGATVRVARLPWPDSTPEVIVSAVEAAISTRTRLLVTSHVASASSLVMPAEKLCGIAARHGVPTLIDGAHAPGQVAIDLTSMGCDFYAASCHKWLCTPKGAGLLWAAPAWRTRVRPLALSCRAHRVRPERDGFLCDFDYQGTMDYSPVLCIPAAIAHLDAQIDGGLPALRRANHELAVAGARLVHREAGLESRVGPLMPARMAGSMVTLRLPGEPTPGKLYDERLWDRLAERHGVQTPVWATPAIWPRVLRVSAQLYNRIEDYDRLAHALRAELG